MTIRRFNYTRRRRIRHNQLRFRLHRPPSGGTPSFDAELSLTSLKLPGAAGVFVEAYSTSSYMRFPFGTVERIEPPSDRLLTEIDRGSPILFRVKVVDESEQLGRILAEAEKIHPTDARGGSHAQRTILPVHITNLGQLLWRIHFEGDQPWLQVHQFEGAEDYVAKNTVFQSLVFPAAISQVLTHYLLVERRDPDDGSMTALWIEFAKSFHPEDPPDSRDAEATRAWIDDVVRAFAERMTYVKAFSTARAQEAA